MASEGGSGGAAGSQLFLVLLQLTQLICRSSPQPVTRPGPRPGPSEGFKGSGVSILFHGPESGQSTQYSTVQGTVQHSTVHTCGGWIGWVWGDIYTAIILLLGELSPSPAPLHAQKSKPLQQTPQQIYTGLSCCQGRLPPSPPASICQFYSTPNPQSTSSSRRRSLCVQHLVIAEWGKISTK